jgi:hypothetical protein
MGWGNLTKLGTYTGGQFQFSGGDGVNDSLFDNTSNNTGAPGGTFFGSVYEPARSFVKADADGVTTYRWSHNYSTFRPTSGAAFDSIQGQRNLLNSAPNTINFIIGAAAGLGEYIPRHE